MISQSSPVLLQNSVVSAQLLTYHSHSSVSPAAYNRGSTPGEMYRPGMFFFPEILMSVFLLCAVCAGVAALLWALVVLHRHHKSHVRISALIFLLLSNDVVELLLNLYIISRLLQRDRCDGITCRIFSSLWSSSRLCGVHLQQVVVLENTVSLRYPSVSAHGLCSVMISIVHCFLP
ncbi:hypothetical protein NFI96_024937, partial [Prochilodus magdalenae]